MKYNLSIRSIILMVVFFTTHTIAFAQYNSDNGTFSVSEIKGCAPLSIIVSSNETSCPCDGGCGCDVWPDNVNNPDTFEQNKLNLTYTNPGTYQIQVQVGTFDKDVIEIEVLENINPEFSLSTCTANQVDVEITDSNYDTYEINYNDGSVVRINNGELVPVYTYASSGTKTINVHGINLNASDNCDHTSNNQQVIVLPSLQDAQINSLVLKGESEMELTFAGQLNTPYHLLIAFNGETSFQKYLADNLDASQSTLSINDATLNFIDSYYCFKIGTYDKCSSSYTNYSNTICTVDLNDITVENNQLLLNWTTSNSSVSEYNISRNEISNYFSTTNQTHADQNVECNTEYCYNITSCYNADCSINSTSLQQCATAISTDIPPAITDISIDVSDPNIEVTWELTDPSNFSASEYYLTTIENGVTDTVAANNYTHLDVDQACYTIIYKDACLNISDRSSESCSIFLKTEVANNVTTLSWNDYTGWNTNGVAKYRVLIESSSGNNTYSVGNSTSFELPEESGQTQKINATIEAIPSNSNLPTIHSNTIEIFNSAHIQFPTAFVPDGVNSTFNVKGRYIQSININIYNRWGELVAQIDNKNQGWDGTINEKKAPGGTYIYSAEITDEAGNEYFRKGSITLIRN